MSLIDFYERITHPIRLIAFKISVGEDKIYIFKNSKEYFKFISLPKNEDLDNTEKLVNRIDYSYINKSRLSRYYSNRNEGQWKLFQYKSHDIILELDLTADLIIDFGYNIFNIRELMNDIDAPFEIRNAALRHFSKFKDGIILSNFDDYFSKISYFIKHKQYHRTYREYTKSSKYSDFGYNEWGHIEFYISSLLPSRENQPIASNDIILNDDYFNSFIHSISNNLKYQDARGNDADFEDEDRKTLLIRIYESIKGELHIIDENYLEPKLDSIMSIESLKRGIISILRNLDNKKLQEYDINYHKNYIYERIQNLVLDSYPKRISSVGIRLDIQSDAPSKFIFYVKHR